MKGEGECLVEQVWEGLYFPGAISGPVLLAPVLMLDLWARSLVTALNEALALWGRARGVLASQSDVPGGTVDGMGVSFGMAADAAFVGGCPGGRLLVEGGEALASFDPLAV